MALLLDLLGEQLGNSIANFAVDLQLLPELVVSGDTGQLVEYVTEDVPLEAGRAVGGGRSRARNGRVKRKLQQNRVEERRDVRHLKKTKKGDRR